MGLRALCRAAARLALLAFPRRFRARHGRDMLQLQGERLREAAVRGRVALVRQTSGAVYDLVRAGFAQRLAEARRPSEAGPRASRVPAPRRVVETAADVAAAASALIRRPGFLLLTVMSIALGIAATTTIFSVVDAMFLKPLPYPQPERLRVVGSAWPREPEAISGLSVANFNDLRQAASSFEQLGLLMGPLGLDWRHDDGTSERITAAHATAEIFALLGARTATGRVLQPGEADSVVLSHAVWMREWNGEPGVVGESVVLAGEPLTVVGVLAPDFVPPEGILFGSRMPDFWAPLDLADPSFANARGFGGFWALGRLRQGIDDRAARQELDAIAESLARAYPDANTHEGEPRMIRLRSLHRHTVGDASGRAFLLLGAVALLLSISCINVASMFLVRGHARLGELAVRTALGAGSARLGRLVIVEGALVAGLGGALGAALAYGGVEAFVALSPGDIPRLAEVAFDARGLAFALGASGLTALAFSALPVAQAVRVAPAAALRRRARGLSAPLSRTRAALMVTEVAIAVVLLAAAVTFLRGFVEMSVVDRGLDSQDVLAVEVSSVDRDPDASVRTFRAFAEALRRAPEVQSISGATFSLFSPMGGLWEAAVLPADPSGVTWAHVVLPGFFETLDIPLLAGRDFSWTDDRETAATVIISQGLARQLFGGADPVGRELTLSDERLARVTVIGVAADTLRRTRDGRFVPSAAVYISYLQRPWLSSMVFAVRHRGGARAAADAARDAAREVGSAMTLVDVSPLEALISGTLVEPRFYSSLLTGFSLVALFITAMGIYATLALIVTGRKHEVGIRIALGASPARIFVGVLRYGVVIVGVGVTIGLPMAVYVSGLLDGLVTGIEGGGFATHAVTVAVLLAAGAVAALGPALRALRLEPIQALSHDR